MSEGLSGVRVRQTGKGKTGSAQAAAAVYGGNRSKPPREKRKIESM